MDKQFKQLDRVLKALADPTRLRIVGLLQGRDVCVCHIHESLKISQSKASRHLAYLRRTGLVSTEKRGFWVHYRLAQPPDAISQSILDSVQIGATSLATIQRDRKRLEGKSPARSPLEQFANSFPDFSEWRDKYTERVRGRVQRALRGLVRDEFFRRLKPELRKTAGLGWDAATRMKRARNKVHPFNEDQLFGGVISFADIAAFTKGVSLDELTEAARSEREFSCLVACQDFGIDSRAVEQSILNVVRETRPPKKLLVAETALASALATSRPSAEDQAEIDAGNAELRRMAGRFRRPLIPMPETPNS